MPEPFDREDTQDQFATSVTCLGMMVLGGVISLVLFLVWYVR